MIVVRFGGESSKLETPIKLNGHKDGETVIVPEKDHEFDVVHRVTCNHCYTDHDTDNIHIKDVSEDWKGRDVCTFDCPSCRKEVRSWVNANMKNIILTEYCCGDPEDCDKPCERFGSGYTRGDGPLQGGKSAGIDQKAGRSDKDR